MNKLVIALLALVLFPAQLFSQANWQKITGTGCFSVSINPKNKNTAWFGGLGNVSVSYDGQTIGRTINISASLGVGYIERVRMIFIHPVDTTLILAGAGYGCYKSTDNGATWADALPETNVEFDGEAITFEPNHPDTIYVGLYANFTNGQHPFFRSTNRGLTWQPISIPIIPNRSGFCSIAAGGNGVLIGGITSQAKIIRSTDYGSTWNAVYQDSSALFDSEAPKTTFDKRDTNIVWTTLFQLGKVIKSTDRGLTWNVVTTALVAPWGIETDKDGRVYVGSLNANTTTDGGSHCYVSSNSGASWYKYDAGFTNSLSSGNWMIKATGDSLGVFIADELSGGYKLLNLNNGQHISNSPYALNAASNYQTPTSIKVFLTQGATSDSASYTQVLLRDGVQLYQQPFHSGVTVYTDAGLVQQSTHTYQAVNIYMPTHDTSISQSVTGIVGGSLVPSPPNVADLSVASNGSTLVLRFKTPNTHVDGSVLHNLQQANFNLVGSIAGLIKTDSLALATTDTAKVFYFALTPKPDLSQALSYGTSFVGNTSGFAVNGESQRVYYPTDIITNIYSLPLMETFDNNGHPSVVAVPTWDSTTALFHSPPNSFALLNYAANTNASAYLREFVAAANSNLSFWTVCRTEAGADFGLVEVSTNRGQSWTEKLRLDESQHAEWQAGQNVFFQENVNLSSYIGDTLLVRFRLTSNGSVQKYGWAIDDIAVTGQVGIGTTANKTYSYKLMQNYPNPFNPSTVISYQLAVSSPVRLAVYDILGREVARLVDGREAAGEHHVNLDGSRLSSGIYFYKLQSGNFTETKKMVLLK
jgi:hypothetical protein